MWSKGDGSKSGCCFEDIRAAVYSWQSLVSLRTRAIDPTSSLRKVSLLIVRRAVPFGSLCGGYLENEEECQQISCLKAVDVT